MATKRELPVDRGWAWVVLAGAFSTYVLMSGVFKSFGIIFVAFLETYHETVAVTSLIYSVEAIVWCVSSIFTMTFGLRYFNARRVLTTGAVLLSVAFILSSFATSFHALMFTYSVIVGIGHGLTSGPLIYLLGIYFEERRSMATGIAVAGCSLGGLVMAPLCHHLLDHYGLAGALLLTGALLMHCVPAALLMRPEEFYRDPRRKKRKKRQEVKVTRGDKQSTKPLVDHGDSPDHAPYRPRSATTDSTFSPLARQAMLTRMRSRTESETVDGNTDVGHSVQPDVVQDTRLGSQNRTIGLVPAPPPPPPPPQIVKSHKHQLFNNESILSASVLSLRDKNNFPGDESDSCLGNIFNVNILKNKQFLLFLVVYGFGTLGSLMPTSYIPALAKDRSLSTGSAAIILSIAGASDMFGRAFIGTVCDFFRIEPRRLLMISLVISAILHNLVMLIDVFWHFVLYAVLYGFFGSYIYCLYSSILIDILQLDNLKSALAIVHLTEGIGCGIVNPVIGLLRDVTGQYNASFHFLGCGLAVAIVCLIIEMVISHRKKKEEIRNDSFAVTVTMDCLHPSESLDNRGRI